MQLQELSKLCADSLRTLAKDKYNVKLKSAHAHELVAAYFGYNSKNAMLSDFDFSIDKIKKSEVVVMIPDDFLDQRRASLQDLSPNLPDSYSLGEAFYTALFRTDWWFSPHPPFKDFKSMAKFLIENNESYKSAFILTQNIPFHHYIEVENKNDSITLHVLHTYETSKKEKQAAGKTTIFLPRMAGKIGYGKPLISVGRYSGEFRKIPQNHSFFQQ